MIQALNPQRERFSLPDRELLQALGEAQLLKPVVLEYCSVFQKFYGQVPMSGDFQDSDRIRVKAQMIRTLLAAIGKEHNG